MLTRCQSEKIATGLITRLGETALAALVWKCQEALTAGRTQKLADLEQILLATERALPH